MKKTKLQFIIFALAGILLLIPNHVYAETEIESGNIDIDYCNLTETDLSSGISDNPTAPTPLQFICPLINLLNIVTVVVGFALVLMIFLGAYKYAMAQGDPKGMDGAKSTLTYAVMGFLVVAGMYLVLRFVQGAFGIRSELIFSPFKSLEEGIKGLMDFANITY